MLIFDGERRNAALDVSPVPSQPAPETQPTNEAHEGETSQGFLEADAHWKCSCGARGVAESLIAARGALAGHVAARQQDEPARAEEEQA